MIKYVFIKYCAKCHEKISYFGVDFDQYFYVSIDFVLDTLIENIGQNQLPKLTLFHEISHTVVKTNMNSYGKKKLHICLRRIGFIS